MAKSGPSLEELEAVGREALEETTEEVPELTPEEAEAKAKELAEKKARIVQVLSRGVLNDRLAQSQNLDSSQVGLWVRETREDVDRIRALGGELVTGGDVEGLHGAGDGRKRVGDLVLMSMPRDDYELIQLVRAERRAARLNRGKKEYTEKFVDGRQGAPGFDER